MGAWIPLIAFCCDRKLIGEKTMLRLVSKLPELMKGVLEGKPCSGLPPPDLGNHIARIGTKVCFQHSPANAGYVFKCPISATGSD